jgi:hypothetical protein
METTDFKTVEQICADIKENILNMYNSQVVALHNEYCRNMSYYDDEIFENDPFLKPFLGVPRAPPPPGGPPAGWVGPAPPPPPGGLKKKPGPTCV